MSNKKALKKSKKRVLIAVLTPLMAVAVGVCALVGAILGTGTGGRLPFGDTADSTANVSGTTINIGASTINTASKAGVQELINYVAGSSSNVTYNALSTQMESWKGSGSLSSTVTKTKTADNFTTKTVTMGGIVWNVMYVSKADNAGGGTEKGDVIVTLWQADSNTSYKSMYANNWYADTPLDKYPSAMYGSSLVRSTLVGSSYVAAKGATSLTPGTQNPHWAPFTSGNFSSMIATPANMKWQETQTAASTMKCTNASSKWNNFPYPWHFPNDAYGTVNTAYGNDSTAVSSLDRNGSWYRKDIANYDGGTTTRTVDYNYMDNDATVYTAWKNDKLWLPSMTETGWNDTSWVNNNGTAGSGLWNANNTQRAAGNSSDATTYAWLRSGYLGSAYYACGLNSTGGYYDSVTSNTRAVRPALHLNLKSAAQAAGLLEQPITYHAEYGTAPENGKYTPGSTDVLKPVTNVPEGLAFSGWRKGSLTGEAISTLTGQTDELNLYATYTPKAASAAPTPSEKTLKVTYGATDVTLSAALSHALLGGGNLTVSTYWRKEGSTENIATGSGITVTDGANASIKFDKPTCAQSGKYTLYYTLTPSAAEAAKGVLPLKDQEAATFTLTVDGATCSVVEKPTLGEGKIYVGQSIVGTQLSGGTVKCDAAHDNNVAGTWEIVSKGVFTSSGKILAKFTPDDENMAAIENVEIPTNAEQLLMKLDEDVSNVSGTSPSAAQNIAVDYGSTVAFAIGETKITFTVTQDGKETTVDFALSAPEGYTPYLHRAVSVDSNKTEIHSGDAILSNITANKLFTVSYRANDTAYVVYYLLDNANTGTYTDATTPDALDELLSTGTVYKYNGVAPTGSAVKYFDENGKPLNEALAGAADIEQRVLDTDKTGVIGRVEGDGSTVALIYLALKKYTVSFTASGAAPSLQTKEMRYGATLTDEGINPPTKLSNTFAGWYYDSECTQEVGFGTDKISGNVTIYAKFTTKQYSMIFDMNIGNGTYQLPASGVQTDSANLVNHTVTWDVASLFNETFKFGEAVGNGRYQITYDVNNVASNKNIRGIRPSAIGYTFGGWFAEGATSQTDVIRKPNSSTADEIVLTARWAPSTYTMRFDKQDGSRVTTKTVRNMSAWGQDNTALLPGASGAILPANPERSGYIFEGWYVTADKNDTNYMTVHSVSNFTDASGNVVFNIAEFAALGFYGNSADGYNFNNLTIYAGWRSVDVILRVADSEENPMQGSLVFRNSEGAPISETDAVHIGNEITVEGDPDDGYKLVNIIVGGRSLAAGTLKFTVNGRDIMTEENEFGETVNYIEVSAVFDEERYTITYDTTGGRSTDSTFARTYSASELDENSLNRAKLPSLLTKRGYDFIGWVFSTDEEENAYDTVDDPNSEKGLYGAELWLKRPYNYAETGYRNITLKAVWRAQKSHVYLYNASYNADYNYDEAGKRYVINQYNTKDLTTDMEIEINNPSRGDSFVFLGWATSRNGVVVYPAVEGKDTITYTVNADKDENGNLLNRNNLYAVWHIAGVNYIIMSADNNNCVYGGDGITMSAQTARKYEADEVATIKLNYTWYKIYDGQYDNCFDVKEYEDAQGYKIYVDDTDAIVAYEKDGKYYGADKQTEISKEQAEAYGSKLTYKEFNATKALEGGFCEVKTFKNPITGEPVKTTDLSPSDVLKVNVRDVNDCGIYICVVEVVSTESSGSKTSVDGYGEIEITMNKAVYDGVNMVDTSIVYNATSRANGISVTDANGGYGKDPVTGVNYLTLPDGSRLIVTYRYFVGEGAARKEITDLTQITNVGTYHVVASFEFTPDGDKGNYELPATIAADLSITARSIGEMQYEFMHGDTVVTTDTAKFSGGYDGDEYKVAAKMTGRLGMDVNSPLISETDDVAFEVKVYRVSETGSATEVTGPTTEAGSYYIEIVGLKGADAGNYALGSGLTLRADYTITKAKYDVADHIKFNNDEVTFDNEIHTIGIKLDDGYNLPDTVTLTYNTEYAAEEEDFTTDDYWLTDVPSNGGRYAGVYTVTVTFTDTASGNYEALESMSATLTIKKAKFFDFYNKDGIDLLRDAGFVNATYAYTVGTNYNPYIASGILINEDNFAIEYEYYRVAETQSERTLLASGTHADLVQKGNLISLAGKYEIVAKIGYVSAIYRNNFEEITESESTITYVIREVAVEKVEVVEWADGFDRVVKLGAGFDFGEGENYGWIKKILVTYAQDEQGQGGGTLEVVSPADIRLAGIKFEQKNNVDQTTFWKVGAFNVIVSFYGTESEAYVFTVKETINSVQVQYSTDGGNNYHDVPADGIEFVEGAEYQFAVLYTGTDASGKTNVQMRSAAVAADTLKLGSNKLTVTGADNYVFANEISVDMYKVVDGDVKWQYSLDGEHWADIPENGRLVYAGVEYKIRATFEDGGKTQELDAKALSGLAVLNVSDYVMTVGRSGNYKLTAEYSINIVPLVIEVTWDSSELKYNTYHQSPKVATSNRTAADAETLIFDYEFTDKDGATLTSANVINVGEYVVKLVLTGSARDNYTVAGSNTAEQPFTITQADIEMTVTYSEHNYGPNKTYAGNPQGLRLNALKADFGDHAAVEGEFAFITNYNEATGKYDIADGESLKALIANRNDRLEVKYVYLPKNEDDQNNYKAKIGTIILDVQSQTAKSGAGALSVEFGEDAVEFYLVNQLFDTHGIEVYLLYQSAYEEDGVWYGKRDRIESPSFRIGSMAAQGYQITAQDLSSEKVVLRAISGSNSGTLDVKVVDKVAQGLEVSSTGHRTEYYIGETFDFSDMEFRVTFGDGTSQDGLKKGSIKADFSGAFTEVGTKTVRFTYFNVYRDVVFTVSPKQDLQIIEPANLVLTYRNGEELQVPQLKAVIDGITYTQSEFNKIGVSVRVEVTDKSNNQLAVLGEKKEGLYNVRYIFTVTNPRFNTPRTINLEVRVTENPYQVDIDTASVDGQKVAYTGEYIAIPKAVVGSVTDTTTDTTVPSNYVIIEYTINGERVTSESQWTRTALNRGAYEVIVTVKVRRNGEADYTAATASYTFEVTQAVNDKGNASIEVHPVILGEGADFNFKVTADFGADTATFEYSRTGNANDWTSEVPTEAGTWFVRAKIAGTENYQGIDEIIASFEVRIAEKQADTSEEGSVEGSVSGSDGIGADWKLTIKESEIEDVNINKQTSLYGYTVSLVDKNGVAVETTGEYKVSIKLTAEQVEALSGRTDIRLFLYGADGKATAVEAEVKDGYLEFTTENFGRFVITSVIPDAPTVPVGLLVAVIIGAVAAAGMIAAVVVVAVKKRKGAQE